MHRYRAILIDSGNLNQERPLQIFGNDRRKLEEWAADVLRNAVSEDAAVLIYQTIEQQVGLIPKRQKEEPVR